MKISVSGRLPRGVTEVRIHAAIREAFRSARRKERGDVSVQFVTEKAIAKLNRYACGKERPTDVLAFPSEVSAPGEKEWGDIFIATTYAERQAEHRHITVAEEIFRLVIHGVLHLLGYDHRHADEEADMFGRQERALQKIYGSSSL